MERTDVITKMYEMAETGLNLLASNVGFEVPALLMYDMCRHHLQADADNRAYVLRIAEAGKASKEAGEYVSLKEENKSMLAHNCMDKEAAASNMPHSYVYTAVTTLKENKISLDKLRVYVVCDGEVPRTTAVQLADYCREEGVILHMCHVNESPGFNLPYATTLAANSVLGLIDCYAHLAGITVMKHRGPKLPQGFELYGPAVFLEED